MDIEAFSLFEEEYDDYLDFLLNAEGTFSAHKYQEFKNL